MVRLLVLFLFFQITNINSVLSQSIKKAYRHYERGELVKLKETLEKLDEKSVENSGKYFMYTLLYLEQKEERNVLNSAYKSIIISKENYQRLDPKDLEELTELKIDMSRIDSVEDVIDSLEYQFVLEINSIGEYIEYVINYPNSRFVSDAVSRRNTLEFSLTSNQNTWQAYKIYMDSFPLAEEYSKAKTLYEKLIFADLTQDGTISSYENFISEYPDTPYRDSIEITLLKKYTVDNSPDGFIKFISNFPKSKYSETAANFLYHLMKRDLSKLKGLEIDKVVLDSLEKISSVDKISLIGIYEEPFTNFINGRGEKILSNSSYEFDLDYFCSFTLEDFLVAKRSDQKVILGRDFTEIYSNNFSYVEDMGVGLIKVFSEEGLSILHKSGKLLLDGEYDNAYLVNDSYLLIESDEDYILFTVMGERVFDSKFSDVYKEGPFIIFESADTDKISVTNSSKISELFLEDDELEFLYADYEFFEGNFMILISDGEESLVNINLEEIVKMGNNKIDRTDFGWVYNTEYGIKLITDLFETDFSKYYESVSNNSNFVLTKYNGYWDVFSKDSMAFILNDKDSVFALSASTLWFRDKFKEAILFSNYSQIDLPEIYDLKVMKSKYGSSTFFKVSGKEGTYILDELGNTLPSAEYYYTVESGNTVSFLSKKFNISQAELLRLNNKKNKNLFIGERLKIKGYIPNDAVSDSLFLIEYNGKKGISNLKGEIVLEPQYDGLTNFDENNLILIQGEKFGNYSLSDGKIIAPNYPSIVRAFGESMYKVPGEVGVEVINSNSEILLSSSDKIEYWNDSSTIVFKDGKIALYTLGSQEKILEFDSYKIIDDSLGIMMIESEGGYGLYSSKSGIILNLSYNQIQTLYDEKGNIYFKAIQFMPDAQLLVSIIINYEGNIVINQGLDMKLSAKLFCTESI